MFTRRLSQKALTGLIWRNVIIPHIATDGEDRWFTGAVYGESPMKKRASLLNVVAAAIAVATLLLVPSEALRATARETPSACNNNKCLDTSACYYNNGTFCTFSGPNSCETQVCGMT